MTNSITVIVDKGVRSVLAMKALLDADIPFEIRHSKDYPEYRHFPRLLVNGKHVGGLDEVIDMAEES